MLAIKGGRDERKISLIDVLFYRNALSLEKDNHLVKEKIIEDQSQTICCLQYQIKEKMSELSKAREETVIAENEMARINNDLIQKHKSLEKELNEKEQLLKKLKVKIKKIALGTLTYKPIIKFQEINKKCILFNR